MEEKGPRFKSMLLERRIPLIGKKEEFENLISSRRSLINELRRRKNQDLEELNKKILEIENEILKISLEE